VVDVIVDFPPKESTCWRPPGSSDGAPGGEHCILPSRQTDQRRIAHGP
jgi:hypothetical protein